MKRFHAFCAAASVAFVFGIHVLPVAGVAQAQDITISGPLEVQQSLSVEGSADLQGRVTIDGNATVNDNLTVDGDLTVDGAIDTPYFQIGFSEVASVDGNVSGGGTATDSETVDSADFCALSYVYIAGEDKGSSDIGACQVTRSSSNALSWTVTATVGNDTDLVECQMVCLELPFVADSTQ